MAADVTASSGRDRLQIAALPLRSTTTQTSIGSVNAPARQAGASMATSCRMSACEQGK